MSGKIFLGILDDHPIILDAYKLKLKNHPDIEVVWTATYFLEAQEFLSSQPIDVLILDAGVPISAEDQNNYPVFATIRDLSDRHPDMAILVISMHNRRAFINSVMRAGASGYVLKNDPQANSQLGDIIRVVDSGEIYFSPLVEKIISAKKDNTPALTPRQLEVLSIYASSPNLTHADMAKKLHIAPSTLRNLLSGTYTRLGVRKLNAALDKARSLGLITPTHNLSDQLG